MVDPPVVAPPALPAVTPAPEARDLVTTLAQVHYPIPALVQAIDRLGEIAAVLAGAWLCATGKIGGMEWMVFSGAVLGVQNTIRATGARRGTAAVGAIGAVLLAIPHIFASQAGPGAVAASGAAAEIARRAGHGFVRAAVLAVLGLVALLLALVVALAGCPRLPPPEGCTPHASRCSPRGVPQICSSTQRWTNAAEDTCASVGVVCCAARDTEDAGTVHACVPPSWCLAADGGVR